MDSDSIANKIIDLKTKDLQLGDALIQKGKRSNGHDKAMEKKS